MQAGRCEHDAGVRLVASARIGRGRVTRLACSNPIGRYTSGAAVLDLFGRSGSTPIGAEQTGRKAFLSELDPLYSDVIVQRWEQFTGRKAERSGQVSA